MRFLPITLFLSIVLLPVFFSSCKYNYPVNTSYKVKVNRKEFTYFKEEISKYGIQNGETIVDIGSGNGKFTSILWKFYPKTFFVLEDIQPFKAKKTKVIVNNKPLYFQYHHRFVLGAADSIPIPSSTYDKLLCRLTLHQFTRPDKMAREMYRIMSHKSTLIVVDVEPAFEGEICKGCQSKYINKEQAINIFTQNGFQLKSADTTTYSYNTDYTSVIVQFHWPKRLLYRHYT